MTDYYHVLGVKRTATATEIRSAYRKLARKRHPDVNRGSEKAAREFALLSLAYHTLIDPQERAFHDRQLDQKERGASILESDNPHAQRARTIAAQARWDRVVNQILENDRREIRERQRAVFTTVSLFLSTFFVAMIKPPLWQSFGLLGKVILGTLFMVGIWHLSGRLYPKSGRGSFYRLACAGFLFRSQYVVSSQCADRHRIVFADCASDFGSSFLSTDRSFDYRHHARRGVADRCRLT